MIIIVPSARSFISNELETLWNEHFPDAAISFGLSEFQIYFKSKTGQSNFLARNQALSFRGSPGYNLPEKNDLLCVISLKQKKASYYINGKLFETEKDYISALKNIAFL